MVSRLLCRLSGSLGTPATERWSIGMHYGGAQEEAADGDLLQAWALAIEDALDSGTLYSNLRADWGNNVVLDTVETYGWLNPGPAAAAGAAPVTPALPGTGVPTTPFQCARVISLLTASPGARRRGRVYMPALSPDMAVTGKSVVPTGYLTDVAGLFALIDSLWPGTNPIYLGVYSAVDEVVTAVTSLRAGDVLDTQRRRRDTLPEVFTTQPYTG